MKQRKQTTNRRDFLATAATTAAAISCPYIITSSALGAGGKPAASERIVMAGIGIGNRGNDDLGSFVDRPDVQYVAVCDVKKGARESAKGRVDNHYHNKDCKMYGDFRDVLGRSDIDAVHIATPDHWHAIMVIEACRHGKDVFCEKPETRTIREGRLMVEAARRYQRVVSGGSQRVLEDYRGVTEKCYSASLARSAKCRSNAGRRRSRAICRASRCRPISIGTCGLAPPRGLRITNTA